MNLKKNSNLGIIALLILLGSCRSNDADHVLNPQATSALVKVNLLGADFTDVLGVQPQASVNRETTVDMVGKKTTLLDPGTYVVLEEIPVTASFTKQASLGTLAMIPGDNLSNGIQFRVIVYNNSTGDYVVHRDYVVSGTTIDLVNSVDGVLSLEEDKAYDLVVYSFGLPSLPAITASEQGNINGAKLAYINDTDMMYVKMSNKIFVKGDNTLDIRLRHKTALMQTITVNTGGVLGDITAVTNPSLLGPHYTDGLIDFAGSGKIINRINVGPDKSVNFTGVGTQTIKVSPNILVNGDVLKLSTSNSNGGRIVIPSLTLIDNSSGSPVASTKTNIELPFDIKAEFKQNINFNIRKCGAYIAPNIWKEFMCHNLGADNTLDPNTPVIGLQGAYVQWGRKGPANWRTSGNTSVFAAAPTGGNANDGAISGWNTTEATGSGWTTGNDPCPTGYRIPTREEWEGVIANNDFKFVGTPATGSYATALQVLSRNGGGVTLTLPAAGYRYPSIVPASLRGQLVARGIQGAYWASSKGALGGGRYFQFGSSNGVPFTTITEGGIVSTAGSSVRCIKN
ncbi:TPA: hypothetical protein I9Y74_003701 [Elizabethkingia anophelis]|nr:hypothetical protein [Elizabethkingia anophelis]